MCACICSVSPCLCVWVVVRASLAQGAASYCALKAVPVFHIRKIQAHKQGSVGNCLIAGRMILSPPLNSWGGSPGPARPFCKDELLRQLALDRHFTALTHRAPAALTAKELPVVSRVSWTCACSRDNKRLSGFTSVWTNELEVEFRERQVNHILAQKGLGDLEEKSFFFFLHLLGIKKE